MHDKKTQNYLISSNPTIIKTEKISSQKFGQSLKGEELLQFGNSLVQVLVGFGVVILSMLGLIEPLWIATLMSMFGSVMTMLGVYVCYDVWKNRKTVEGMYKDAIFRAINEQN